MIRMYRLYGLIALTLTVKLFSCTGLFLKNASGGYTYARTLEFGQDLQSQILFIPRAYHFDAPSPTNTTGGISWDSKYAAIGANAFGMSNFVDGINEKGLAGGLFYFPGFAGYQDVSQANYGKSLPMWQLLTWILTNFTTVKEVQQAIPTIFISKAVLPGTTEIIPAHLIIHDASGSSIVIECVNGAVKIHDNPMGIITNSPTFDWHMTNLRNYVNLSPINSPDKIFAGITFSPVSQGSGMFGMPGDYSSPSRFVRIAAFTQAAPIETNELNGIHQAFHMLNNFDIPKGCVRDKDGTVEFTLWTSAIDMKNKIFYCKSYENFQPRKIELLKMDLDAKTHKTFPMKYQDQIATIQ